MAPAARTAEAETVAHLIADEAVLEERLERARTDARSVVEDARREAVVLRERARAEAEAETQAILAGAEEDEAVADVRRTTEARLAELRARAAEREGRALDLLVALATGRAEP